MESMNKHKLVKLNYANVFKNQKKLNSKSNQKNNDTIKISDTNSKMNGFSKIYDQKIYNKNFTINNNIMFKSHMHTNKTNSLNNYINNFKNIYNKNNRANTGNYSYNLNKIIKANNVKNNINDNNMKIYNQNGNNKKIDINNKKIIINANNSKSNNMKNGNNNNVMNILNKKKNNNSINFNNINKLSGNNSLKSKIINNSNISNGNNNKLIKGLKNNKKSIDNSIKGNKIVNSLTPNILINDMNSKTYNNKTFNLNIINSNSNSIKYNNLNANNLVHNFNHKNIQIKTSTNNTITEYPTISHNNKIQEFNIHLTDANNNAPKDDSDINYGKASTSNVENKTGIYETDDVTVTYDKKTGNKIVNEFYFMDTIGRGAYSKVKKCINLKTKEEFAVKILNKRLLRKKKKSYGKTKEGTLKINYMIEDAINEINIYKSFPETNKNVLRLYQILNDNKKDKTYLIMELANKGPLVTLNEKTGVFCINSNYRDDVYDEELIKTWIYDTANGLKFLHENNIVHRDIKSDNILIDKNGHCKIADFGCSIKLKNGQPDLFTKTEGNMYFFPPEFVDGKSKKQFGYKPVDIWAFGVSIYTCIFKSLPFLPENRENVVELFKEIREANFDYNKNGIKISKEMETLLSHILEKDPKKRFTAKDIVEYPWLNNK